MKLEELKNILEATGIPVAYSHFVQSENEPLPKAPFICYLATYSENFHADNKVHAAIQNVQIELYTNRKDLRIEEQVEVALNENELPYETTEAFIEGEELYQKIYEVRLL
jgi:hypothetical protein